MTSETPQEITFRPSLDLSSEVDLSTLNKLWSMDEHGNVFRMERREDGKWHWVPEEAEA